MQSLREAKRIRAIRVVLTGAFGARGLRPTPPFPLPFQTRRLYVPVCINIVIFECGPQFTESIASLPLCWILWTSCHVGLRKEGPHSYVPSTQQSLDLKHRANPSGTVVTWRESCPAYGVWEGMALGSHHTSSDSGRPRPSFASWWCLPYLRYVPTMVSGNWGAMLTPIPRCL